VKFEVGQIVYLLSRKDTSVYPAQVIEEIQRKTLESEIVSYIIRLPNKDNSEVLLEEVNADIFTSLEDLESKMVENAHRQIKLFLDKTRSLEKVFEPLSSEIPTEPSHTDEKLEIDLGGGVKGKISVSELQVGG